jgi:hypothetical protein
MTSAIKTAVSFFQADLDLRLYSIDLSNAHLSYMFVSTRSAVNSSHGGIRLTCKDALAKNIPT